MTVGLRRRADLSPQAFQTYWLEVHAPLIRRLAPTLGILGYVQIHSEPDAHRAPPFDGLAEVWYDSRDVQAVAMRTDAGQEAGRLVLKDELNFIDREQSPRWWGRAHTII